MFNLRSLSALTAIDFKALISLRNLPKFILDLVRWKLSGGKIDKIFVQLKDYHDSAGSARGHYFHQDLLVAQKVFHENPKTHIDIGSRLDGFVSHVASFRTIKVLDIRPLKRSQHPNIEFLQADLMKIHDIQSADSVSCLHAIEHFGLGRYGDDIDKSGHIKGIKNITKLVRTGGLFYVSFPVSSYSRVEFNAHRVFKPSDFLEQTDLLRKFEVESFELIDDLDVIHKNIDYKKIENVKYGCGIFTLRKKI